MSCLAATPRTPRELPDLRDLAKACDVLDLTERALMQWLQVFTESYTTPDILSLDRATRLLYCLVSIRRALMQVVDDLQALGPAVYATVPPPPASSPPGLDPGPTCPFGLPDATMQPLAGVTSMRDLLDRAEAALLHWLRDEIGHHYLLTLPTIEQAVRALWRVVAVRRSIVRILQGLPPDSSLDRPALAFPLDDPGAAAAITAAAARPLDPSEARAAAALESQIAHLESLVASSLAATTPAGSAAPDPDSPIAGPVSPVAGPASPTFPDSPPDLSAFQMPDLPELSGLGTVPPVPACGLVPPWRGDLAEAFGPIEQLAGPTATWPTTAVPPRVCAPLEVVPDPDSNLGSSETSDPDPDSDSESNLKSQISNFKSPSWQPTESWQDFVARINARQPLASGPSP